MEGNNDFRNQVEGIKDIQHCVLEVAIGYDKMLGMKSEMVKKKTGRKGEIGSKGCK